MLIESDEELAAARRYMESANEQLYLSPEEMAFHKKLMGRIEESIGLYEALRDVSSEPAHREIGQKRDGDGDVDVAWARWSYAEAPDTRSAGGELLVCEVCGTAMKKSPGGEVCAKGHGGVEGVTQREYLESVSPRRQ